MEPDEYSEFDSEYDPSFLEYLEEHYAIPSNSTASTILEIAVKFNGNEGFGGVERLFAEIADIYHQGVREGFSQCQK